MAKKRKLFFFDIDGTLQAENDGYIPESAIESVKAIREKGYMAIINTGRTAMNVRDDIRSIGFDGYIFGCGTEVELNGRRIFYNKVDTELCRVLSDAVRSCNAAPLYERSDAMYFDSSTRILPKMQELLDLYDRQGLEVKDLHKHDDFSYDKFCIWYDEETNMSRFRRMIDGCFTYVNRGYGFAELLPSGCTKATGMKMVMREVGADPEDTVAFGDSLNDADMLSESGFGVAMGGAKLLYPYADYITKDLRKHGIAFAIKQNGLL